jgi:hypothetical protein
MCVFDPAIRITAAHPLACGPGVESIPVGTPQNRSNNDTHVSILQESTPDRLQWSVTGNYPVPRRSRAGSMLLIASAINRATILSAQVHLCQSAFRSFITPSQQALELERLTPEV